MSLSCIGRKSYVSQRALSQVLQELKELPEPISSSSRSSVKRSRDKLAATRKTPFGLVIQKIKLKKENGKGEITVPYLHPAAMIAYAAEHCEPFSRFLHSRMEKIEPSYERPWSLTWYSDEVSPGNQLKHDNKRKVQVIYFSLLELGPHALSTENMWFSVLVLRSSVVKELGGMSVLFRQLADLFFKDPDWSNGLPIKVMGRPRLMFAKLGVLISDEAAIKATLSNKGAAGLVFCAACQNAVDGKSKVGREADGVQLVSSFETDISKFRQHTPESVRATMQHLLEQKEVLPKGHFEKLETSLGFNYKPSGLLSHPAMGPDVISCLMYDFFHIYLVHGIFNVHTGMFLADLHNEGWQSEAIDKFANEFSWPARLRGGAAKDLLRKRKPSDALKCSASEALNFMLVLRIYILLFVMPDCSEHLRNSCQAWLSLGRVIDALLQATRKPLQPAQLQEFIRHHLDSAKALYGTEWWLPKCHLALHLPLQLQDHGCILSCFVHERKHKLVKKLANNVLDTSKAFEGAVLEDVVYTHLENLQNDAYIPSDAVRLLEPIRAAPQALARQVQNVLQRTDQVRTSSQAIHGGSFAVSAKDVAVFQFQEGRHVGQVAYHVSIGDTCWSHLTFWTHVHGFLYRETEECALVKTQFLLDTCAYSKKGTDAIVILP